MRTRAVLTALSLAALLLSACSSRDGRLAALARPTSLPQPTVRPVRGDRAPSVREVKALFAPRPADDVCSGDG